VMKYQASQSGIAFGSYAYNAVQNSPSIWAAWAAAHGSYSFAAVKPWVLVVTALTLWGVSLRLLKTEAGPIDAIVAVHTAFFITFIGIQPEHHQWFLPYLIFFAWQRWHAGDRWTIVPAWGFSLCAYGFKIAYGLGGDMVGRESAGKTVFRDAVGPLAELLPAAQWTLHGLTFATGVWLLLTAMKRPLPGQGKR
jgi:hypothetical protein